MITIFDRLQLQAIENGAAVNTAKQRFAGYEVDGLPVYFKTADLSSASNFMNREGKDGTVLEYFQYSKLKDDLLISLISNACDELLKQRLKHLERCNTKSLNKYLFITTDKPGKTMPAMPQEKGYFTNVLRAMGLTYREMSDADIKLFYYQLLSIDDNLQITKKMSIREQVIQRQISYTPDYIKIGQYYIKVLSLKLFPDETRAFQLAYLLDTWLTEYLFTSSFQIGNQNKELGRLQLGKRLAVSSMNREQHMPNEHAQVRYNKASELTTLIATEGHKIGYMSSHLVLWNKTVSGLNQNLEYFSDKLKGAGYFFNEEYGSHDLELFKLLPGASIYSKRQHRILAANYIESLPISSTANGDIGLKGSYPLYLRNKFGELYAFDPGSERRNNWNSMVLGASGSGKSVTMNMLIAHAMYPRIRAEGGKIFIVDFAGAEKSSYLKMARLFGGTFIPIDASGKVRLNPFPPKTYVLQGDKWNTSALTFCNIVLDLILSNRGEGMESDIYRSIIARAVMQMYQNTENPTIKDVLGYIDDDDKEKAALLRKLLQGFLASPESAIVSGEGSISYGNEPFTIFDLQGVSSLPPKLQELITFIVIEEARKAAFKASGFKFVIFDEVAQLIKDPRMVSLIDEMYSTARKYRTGVWTLTQNFASYKESVLSSKIKINTTTTIFLSHAADEEAKRLVAQDFGFSGLERDAFASLHTRKGEYSLAMMRCINATGDETEVVRIELSPLDYWLATSDDRDNQRLTQIQKERNCTIIEACKIAAGG